MLIGNVLCRISYSVVYHLYVSFSYVWQDKVDFPAIDYSDYENMPIQYTAIFLGRKNDNFQMKFICIYIFAQNIDFRRF